MNLRPNPRRPTSRIAVGVVVLALMGLLWVGTAQAACSTTYTVQSGDTLMAIARRCGVTLASLEQANPQIANPRLIFPGEQINVPGGSIIPNTGQQAAIAISPTDGQPGTSVELAGSDFPASSPVNVTIFQAGSPPVYFNTVSTDASGDFSLFLTIPATPPASGMWVIQASSPTNGGATASENVQVVTGLIPITGQQGQLALSPASGSPSTLVTISGSNFPANANLNLTAGAQGATPTFAVPVTADGNGSFTTQLVIPPATPDGSVWLINVASSASGGPSAAAGFQVTTVAPTGLYTVQAGDTLGDLALRFGTTLFGLLRANPDISDPNQIAVGQQIYVPGSIVTINGQNVYIVKSGDTLRAIAAAQNVTLAALEQANPQITDPGLIFPGDHVILP